MSATKVLIAGTGGASLGTELAKALMLAGSYDVFGCDVSPTAYGLYDTNFISTSVVSRHNYVKDVLRLCGVVGAQFLIPGGEEPMRLLSEAEPLFSAAGIRLLGNSAEVVRLCSDKYACFQRLQSEGVRVPTTAAILSAADLVSIGMPCIIKPAMGSGGSANVFFATTVDEAMTYAKLIERMGNLAVGQEYIDVIEGEFTIGVLSDPEGRVIGSIAMKRTLDAKLSVAYRGRGGVISSGYSQGHIGPYREICEQAEYIATKLGSRGPLNVQGRLRNGVLLPFEINPRFSASTYLRAMAGFNEVDLSIQRIRTGKIPKVGPIKPGWYLRSLAEVFVSDKDMKL